MNNEGLRLKKITVGEPINDTDAPFGEGVKIDIDQSGLLLIISYQDPTDKEIKNIQSGKTTFSVVDVENGVAKEGVGKIVTADVIFFLAKFGDLPWMDFPYNVHLGSPEITLPEASFAENTGLPLTVILLDSATKIVKALRLIGLPTGLSRRLKRLIDNQRARPFEKRRYLVGLDRIYKQLKTMDLVKMSLSDKEETIILDL